MAETTRRRFFGLVAATPVALSAPGLVPKTQATYNYMRFAAVESVRLTPKLPFTYTVPAGVKSIYVHVVAGGSGGGSNG